MSYAPDTATRDYHRLHLEMDVAEASPHRLIQLLMQRLMQNLVQATQQMTDGAVGRKGELISNAISIIDCLRTSLNFDAGNEVAANLEALYDYMIRTLLVANMSNDPAKLQDVTQLVREIKEAWETISE